MPSTICNIKYISKCIRNFFNVFILNSNFKLFKLLSDRQVKMIVLSERSEETPLCSMMERRGCHCERLMDQDMGRDERQSLIMLRERREEILCKARLPPGEQRRVEQRDATFKNVPFEEHKIKRGGAAGAGGSQTRWYS